MDVSGDDLRLCAVLSHIPATEIRPSLTLASMSTMSDLVLIVYPTRPTFESSGWVEV
jgi:hypothetical protein